MSHKEPVYLEGSVQFSNPQHRIQSLPWSELTEAERQEKYRMAKIELGWEKPEDESAAKTNHRTPKDFGGAVELCMMETDRDVDAAIRLAVKKFPRLYEAYATEIKKPPGQ